MLPAQAARQPGSDVASTQADRQAASAQTDKPMTVGTVHAGRQIKTDYNIYVTAVLKVATSLLSRLSLLEILHRIHLAGVFGLLRWCKTQGSCATPGSRLCTLNSVPEHGLEPPAGLARIQCLQSRYHVLLAHQQVSCLCHSLA